MMRPLKNARMLQWMIGNSSFIFGECDEGNLNVILNEMKSNTCHALCRILHGIYHGKTPEELALPDGFNVISARALARAVVRYLGNSTVTQECMDLCSFGDEKCSRLTPLCQVLIWQELLFRRRKVEKLCVSPVTFPLFVGNDKLVHQEWKKGTMAYMDVEVGVVDAYTA
jgi:hypothetical protein